MKGTGLSVRRSYFYCSTLVRGKGHGRKGGHIAGVILVITGKHKEKLNAKLGDETHVSTKKNL